MRRYIAAGFGLLVLAGCGSASSSPPPVEEAPPVEAAFGVGEIDDVCDGQCDPIDIDYMKSLVVTDKEILQHFRLRKVLDTLINRAGADNGPDDLWKQWWLSQGKRQQGYPSYYPFCDDPHPFPNQIRDFGFECPRAEEQLAHERLDDHVPVALVNRFDLAPMEGEHCGEYRIVYARDQERGGYEGENLLIFEGVLPNPSPDCGLAGCLPVVEFWQALTTEPSVDVRAEHLYRFYYEGICGFEPVIKPEHYGLNCERDEGGGEGYGGGCGQIRTNQFVQDPWSLREFALDMDCGEPGCELLVRQQPVAQNPHPDLWDSNDPDHSELYNSVLSQLETNLPMPDGINLIAASTDSRLNAGESVIDWWSVYDADSAFENDIDSTIAGLPGGPVANAYDVEMRMTTQSCAGCHELSNGAPLGETSGASSLHWPHSMGFKHIDIGGALSPAMHHEFLPWRAQVMKEFLYASCGRGCFGLAEDQVLVKDITVPHVDRPQREIKFHVLTAEEAMVRFNGGPIPFDTLSGSRTH